MIFFHIKKIRFTLTLLILLIGLQISACSTDNRISAATDNAQQNKQTINETNTNSATMSDGIGSGAVIKDDAPDNNNLLDIIGKPNIANLGIDNTNFIANAIINGVNTGSVTKDIDPNNNNLLEIGAKLNITDPDTGEAAFIAKTINGTYGSLTINTTGTWNYVADNTQATIQNLTASSTLTDSLMISSIDGTTHTIIITILGVDKNTATTNITLSWVAPIEREDNSPLSLSAIAGYNIYYGTTSGQYPNSASINDGSATGYVFSNFTSATYYFVVTTIDTDGRESLYSTEISNSI